MAMPHPLEAFLAAHDWDALRRLNGWELTRWAGAENLLRFSLTARDGERYHLLLDCSDYPDSAPSVVFVNDQGSKTDPRAWPAGTPRFYEVVKPPPHCFLCMPLTREGLTHHPDWNQDPQAKPWNKDANTLMDVLNYIDRLLGSKDYIERRTCS